ncbi:MAG TPA: hypothetical protein VHM26_08135 [Chitinophagaceae bacterium]|jgi:ABC-type transporter MlaC component|nr:hypothetical protein [Chitinophagaceae bacterium]
MKKLLLLSLIFTAVISTSVYAQPSQPAQAAQPAQPAIDQEAMLKKMKEQFKAPMVEKTGLTEAQVDKVIEINLAIRLEAGAALQGLNEADRSKKLAEFKAEKEKRYSAIPLTAEQIKSVYAFYEDMAKNQPRKNN